MANTLDIPLHVKYIQSLGENKDDLVYHMTAHLRMNADALDRDAMIDFVMSCWDEEAGGFGSHPDHDAHLLSTLSAIQILTIQGATDRLDVPRVTKFILSLQQESGIFSGDQWGEIDTRFLFYVEKTVGYLRKCRNFDGGFGAREGAESHAAQVYVCVGALALLDRLDEIDQETLGWWLSERQLPNGGLNGRPEKLEDVCYSFWVLSSLCTLNKVAWINSDKLIEFILSAQDFEHGGIADRPGDQADVFHTNFGLAGLSLLGYPGLEDLDPLIESLGLRKGWTALPRQASCM
ncbi:rab geranylgeranyltransferase [Epithele typhae]|uniref:rab geranylgeranyltransferase n=1 Tax=Epithele typhae TaxID=378194 RepID=UPI002007BFFB|nr:rab geranylgeranyltransferase [Epithele typhae]KAH9946202.1 rab geranylgeranyltransferase [Epithele typhae]